MGKFSPDRTTLPIPDRTFGGAIGHTMDDSVADWSFIPGGVISGTALIRPDLPELKIWPFFWQQTEYVMGGGATNYMFLVLAANHMYNSE